MWIVGSIGGRGPEIVGGALVMCAEVSESESESLPLEEVQSSSVWGFLGVLDVDLARDGIDVVGRDGDRTGFMGLESELSSEISRSFVLRRLVG